MKASVSLLLSCAALVTSEVYDVDVFADPQTLPISEDVEELNHPNNTKVNDKGLFPPTLDDEDFDDDDDDDTRSLRSTEAGAANSNAVQYIGQYCSLRYNNQFWVEGTSYAYITPPSNGGYYYDRRACYYYFHSAVGKRVQAYCWWTRTVSPDYLKLYGGTGNSVITLTGSRGAFTYTSTGNYLFMGFQSDHAIRWNGFSCRIGTL